MEYLITLIGVIVSAMIFSKLLKSSNLAPKALNTKNKLPPGPPGWPLIGNLGQVILQKKNFIDIVRDLRPKYGPIFTLKMGQRTFVVITSSELMHEALVQKGDAFANRPKDSVLRTIFSVGKCAITAGDYGPLWRVLRRNMITQMTNPLRIRQCGWIREWAMENHLQNLMAEARKKGFVEVYSCCRLSICSIFICMCVGTRLSKEKIQEIESLLKEVMLMLIPKLPEFLPVLMPLFSRQVGEARKLRKRQMECLVPLIRKREHFVKNDGQVDEEEMVSPIGAAYIDSLFDLDPPGRGHLGEEELVTLVSELIIGGTDTSSTILEWAMLHLVQDQAIQENLYNEIVHQVGPGGKLEERHVEKMTYLNAIVKETLRRHPPTHFTLSHAAVESTELGGYTIPTGVNVEFYTAWMTKDPKVWTDPEMFQPERFLNGDGVGVDLTGTKGVKIAPFGAGKRICPAFNLGLLHVNLMLARMIQAFKWLPVPDSPLDPTETFVVTISMKNPLKSVIQPRIQPQDNE